MNTPKPIFKLHFDNKIKKAYIDTTSYLAFKQSIAQSLHITDIQNYDIQYTDQDKDPISITDQTGLNIALDHFKNNPSRLTITHTPYHANTLSPQCSSIPPIRQPMEYSGPFIPQIGQPNSQKELSQ